MGGPSDSREYAREGGATTGRGLHALIGALGKTSEGLDKNLSSSAATNSGGNVTNQTYGSNSGYSGSSGASGSAMNSIASSLKNVNIATKNSNNNNNNSNLNNFSNSKDDFNNNSNFGNISSSGNSGVNQKQKSQHEANIGLLRSTAREVIQGHEHNERTSSTCSPNHDEASDEDEGNVDDYVSDEENLEDDENVNNSPAVAKTHGVAQTSAGKDLASASRNPARFNKRRDTSDGLEADLARELVTAVSAGDRVTIGELLERGVPADACMSPSKSAWSLLHVACTEGRGDPEIVKLLLEFGADANATTTEGLAPLHFCAMESHFECAKVLLDFGADPNKLDSEGLNPLLRACMARQVQPELAELLIQRGTNVEYADPEGWTALHMAARYSLDRIAGLILSSGASVDCAIPSNKWSPLMLCCTEGAGSRSILEMLIKAGANVENRSAVDITALHIACYNNYPELVGLLLDAGADTSVCDKHGRSVLHKACLATQPSLASARLLVERGVNVRARDNQGQTPLHYAAAAGSEPFCKMLLMRDSSRGRSREVLVDMEDADGRTALLTVCSARVDAPSVVRLLLSYGAEPGHMDNAKCSALNLAVEAGNVGAAQMLLEQAPCDVNHPDEECRTPLHMAFAGLKNFDPAMVSLLLDHDADPDRQDDAGNTCLHYCAQADLYEAAQLFIDSASPAIDLLDDVGRTPFLTACAAGSLKTAQLLLKADSSALTNVDIEGHSALRLAALGAHAKVVAFLLQQFRRGAPVFKDTVQTLVDACSLESPSIALQLLDAGAPSLGSLDGTQRCSPLLASIRSGHHILVQRLRMTSTPQQTNLSQNCPKGHSLQPFAGDDTYTCDFCCVTASDDLRSTFRSCRTCKVAFDVCGDCRASAGANDIDPIKFARRIKASGEIIDTLLSVRSSRTEVPPPPTSAPPATSSTPSSTSVSSASPASQVRQTHQVENQEHEAPSGHTKKRASILSRLTCNVISRPGSRSSRDHSGEDGAPRRSLSSIARQQEQQFQQSGNSAASGSAGAKSDRRRRLPFF